MSVVRSIVADAQHQARVALLVRTREIIACLCRVARLSADQKPAAQDATMLGELMRPGALPEDLQYVHVQGAPNPSKQRNCWTAEELEAIVDQLSNCVGKLNDLEAAEAKLKAGGDLAAADAAYRAVGDRNRPLIKKLKDEIKKLEEEISVAGEDGSYIRRLQEDVEKVKKLPRQSLELNAQYFAEALGVPE